VSAPETDEILPHPRRRLLCRVAAVDALTHDIRRVLLAIEQGGPFAFSAGQFASLGFAALPPRDYSMASRPEEPRLEFHIRRMGTGSVSDHVAGRLRPGDPVSLAGPLGTAYLRERHRGPILAIAGGSGLAPIKSIVETALARDPARPIRLYVGARDARDLYLVEHFIALAARHGDFRFVSVLSEPGNGTVHRIGLVQDAAAEELSALPGAKAYLAGPPAMVEAAHALLRARGLPGRDIHADAFYSAAEMAARAAATP
jgi:ferredoxin-NAD(P)+ reductase (naphthalene dioxygenase ferredoxin-specific)